MAPDRSFAEAAAATLAGQECIHPPELLGVAHIAVVNGKPWHSKTCGLCGFEVLYDLCDEADR